jgi:multidrug efflux pump subunit AcrA (membrane-fusion protein)
MNKRILIGAGLIISVVVLVLIYQSTKGSSSEDVEVLTEAQFGDFIIDVTTTGELEAKSSVRITGPNGLQQAQIWQIKIDDIVEEGTLVKKGDYIAKLEQTQLMDKIQQEQNDLSQSDSKYTEMKLDTALELRKARDELINLEYEITTKKIIVEQSKFEPPATQTAAQIEFEKAERAHKQAFDGYKLRKEKAVAQMQQAWAERQEDQTRVDFLMRLAQEFTVTAPEDGMVIYARTWNGTKKGVGSTVQAWDPVVATLPDLNKMISKTYVNEVDIRVVKVGQTVQVGLDAFPAKKLTGKVITVANVGEQKPNSDAKVFQVDILINESDTTLRPAMTTSNTIIAEVVPGVVFVPLESLHSQGDTLTYVIKKDGLTFSKQEVKVGKTNADKAVILEGVKQGEIVYLSNPTGYESKRLIKLPEKGTSVASSN